MDIRDIKVVDHYNKVNCIEIDPPWDAKRDKGYQGGGTRIVDGKGRKDPRLNISPPYPTMTLKELEDLAPTIKAISDPDGTVLYMWATNLFLPDAFRLGEAWGFRYSGVIYTWVKSLNGAGTGRRARHDTEHCLLFFRGKVPLPVQQTLHSTAFALPKPKREPGKTHSAKPQKIKEIAEVEYPQFSNRVEIFGREARNGWAIIGNGK